MLATWIVACVVGLDYRLVGSGQTGLADGGSFVLIGSKSNTEDGNRRTGHSMPVGQEFPAYAEAYFEALRRRLSIIVAVDQSNERCRQLQKLAQSSGCLFAVAHGVDGFSPGIYRLVPRNGGFLKEAVRETRNTDGQRLRVWRAAGVPDCGS